MAVLAKSLGVEIKPGELTAIFESLDKDRNGKVDFEEFKAWWHGATDIEFAWV